MKRLLIVFSLLIFNTASADLQSHAALTDELLTTMNIEGQMMTISDNVKIMQLRQIELMNLPQEARPLVQEYLNNVSVIISKQFAWANIKNDYVAAYMLVFSENDIKELLKFYKSAVGRKFVAKTPELTSLSMKIAEKQMQESMPLLQAEQEKFGQALEKLFPEDGSATPTEPGTPE